MLTGDQKNRIQLDFEKFIVDLKRKGQRLDFEFFGEYGCSVINYYVGQGIINPLDRLDAALLLTKLFNKGLKNIISENDVVEISESLAQDMTLNYSILQPILSSSK